jgi:predicted ester cyclase
MKKIALLSLVILLVAGGCAQKKDSDSQLEELLAKTEMERQNKAIAQKIFDGLNQKDLSYAELYSPDCKYYLGSSNPNPTTREDDINASKANWHAIPDLRFRVEDMVAEGNKVAARFSITGTHQEEWFGIPPTQKSIQSGGIVILRFDNGKVVEQREDFDVFGTFMQLGMELRPAGSK